MKEQTLIEMKNKADKVEPILLALKQVIDELNQLRDLSVGTLELVKGLPGYKEALDKLKDDITKGMDEKKLEIDPAL